MVSLEKIVAVKPEEFETLALELFRFQARECKPYGDYLRQLGVNSNDVNTFNEIPYLPIELFKTHKIYCGSGEPEKCFTSSTTGGDKPSRHYIASLDDYQKCFTHIYEQLYGAMPIYALLPCYLEREGSSLVYMVDKLIESNGGGFFLNDYENLLQKIAENPEPKILLGVSYALLDLAEQFAPKLQNTIVMETGGMKGRREELLKVEMHKILCDAFGVGVVHSEYGMAELMSQAYSSGNGIFRTPNWMRVSTRDINDPFESLGFGQSGGVNIIDLSNRFSCAFIQTQDMGKVFEDGSFELLGRINQSQTRGCNLLIQ